MKKETRSRGINIKVLKERKKNDYQETMGGKIKVEMKDRKKEIGGERKHIKKVRKKMM